MFRKLILLGAALAVVLVAGATIAGVTVAQQGRFTHIQSQKEGDEAVVAVIEGKDLTRGDVRRSATRNQAMDSTLSNTDARKEMLYIEVEKRFLEAEVERRKLVLSDEEVQQYMAPNREACERRGGEECLRYIRDLGYEDADAFWKDAFDDFQTVLGQNKLIYAELADRGYSGSTDTDEFFKARETYVKELREEADIVWHDDDLEREYREAVRSRDNKTARVDR